MRYAGGGDWEESKSIDRSSVVGLEAELSRLWEVWIVGYGWGVTKSVRDGVRVG